MPSLSKALDEEQKKKSVKVLGWQTLDPECIVRPQANKYLYISKSCAGNILEIIWFKAMNRILSG